jgi:hypothetical protein
MLKHAVAVSNMAGSPVGTPPGQISVSSPLQVPPGIEDVDEDEPLDHDDKKHSISDASHQASTRKWRKPTTTEKFVRDLQYFVTPRQRGPFYFVKFVVFFIMLPCGKFSATVADIATFLRAPLIFVLFVYLLCFSGCCGDSLLLCRQSLDREIGSGKVH